MLRDLFVLTLCRLFDWITGGRYLLVSEIHEHDGDPVYVPWWYDTGIDRRTGYPIGLRTPPLWLRWGQWAYETADAELAWLAYEELEAEYADDEEW